MHKKFPFFLNLRMIMGNREKMSYLSRGQFYYHLLRLKPMFYRFTPYKPGGEDAKLARGTDVERADMIGENGMSTHEPRSWSVLKC